MSARVLLVDDDEFARGFARTVLERAGFNVVEADDVASAVELVNSSIPAIVVTDWSLPDGNGGILARKLRETHALVPLILVTGDPTAVESQQEIASKFAAILTKPYLPSVLERALREALSSSDKKTCTCVSGD